MSRILILTRDKVGENMAGPAIRCWEFARALSRESHQVTLATSHPTSLSPDTFKLVQYDAAQLEALAAASDLIILSGFALWLHPTLKLSNVPLVIDIYDPFLVESLPLLSNQPELERNRRHIEVLDALTDLLVWGDFFLCSSEKQRDYWLGWLNALDRINPLTYDDDPTFQQLIDIVAFGLPSTPPQHTRAVLKGVRPGIAETDRVIMWGGGVYNWFDPLTLLYAMKRVSAQRSDVKLFFLGIRHPSPDIDSSVNEMGERAVALSKELGLYEKNVFFNDWTPYDERQNYLLEADVGVSLHFSHLETHFSFRTRLLDYIWAGLPVIVTQGDVLGDLIEDHQLGWAVGYESVDDVTAAILKSADVSRSEFSDRFSAITPQLNWDVALQPLIKFCREPRCAPDRHRARNDWQSLAGLKLTSHIDAMRRDINEKDKRMIYLESVVQEHKSQLVHMEHLKNVVTARDGEIEHLQDTIKQIRQGRVMRLMDGINHIIKGAFLK
ncbi:MAG: glycosyltransferase family 4 protein [Chloroflexi bacterium]|nr:glycosyltransferase family 4 protein [Chloroflexota bacterium]